jgi:3-oxoacyl-(acyl-carrier-protein) synthase
MSSRVWQILATICLLSLPAWGAGFMDPATFERDVAAGNALMDQWIKWTQVAAAKLAGSSQEGAEVVAVAVFGGCSGFQERFYQHLLRIKMTVSQADDLIAKIRAKMHDQIIAQVPGTSGKISAALVSIWHPAFLRS